MSKKIGIIGGGVMGEAILSGLISQQIYLPENVIVSEPQPQRQEFLQDKYKIKVTSDNLEAASMDVLLLAIKPQILDVVTANLENRKNFDSNQLVISILAGIPLSRLEAGFPNQPVIRVMPNTPLTVGAGITAIASGKKVEQHHIDIASEIFTAVGEVIQVPEYLMDAVTGVSGSGPAFVAIAIEALADGGVSAGLPRPLASQLAVQTVLGTAKLIQDSGLHPAQLKDQVTSPGGTTIAGVTQLEKHGFRYALIEAVKAAYLRSKELGSDS